MTGYAAERPPVTFVALMAGEVAAVARRAPAAQLDPRRPRRWTVPAVSGLLEHARSQAVGLDHGRRRR